MQVVYGVSPCAAPGLVFIKKEKALELKDLLEAVLSSTTWGELKRRIPKEEYERFLEFQDERPRPKDEFDMYKHYPPVHDGDWPEWPEQEMLSWVPREIMDEFGKREDSVHNGPFAVLDETRENEILLAFERHGYRCTRDEDLVSHFR